MLFLLIAFVVAFCSMCYELVLAQTVTLLYGSTVFNYTLIIGVFIFGLGMGASLHAWRGRVADARLFWILEIVLSMLGCGAPLLILGSDILLSPLVIDWVTPLAAVVGGVIGFLSGMEIPFLIDLAHKDKTASAKPSTVRKIIALDFIGTFAAAVVVPLVCFPFMGLFRTAVLTGASNAVIALILFSRLEGQARYLKMVVTVALILVLGLCSFFADDLSSAIFQRVY